MRLNLNSASSVALADAVRPVVEVLEARDLFAIGGLVLSEAMVNGAMQLRIQGTSASDQIRVWRVSNSLRITSGKFSATRSASDYGSLRINGGAGNDSIVISGSVNTPAIVYSASGNDTIVGGAGNDTLYGGTGIDSIRGGAGDDTIVTIGGYVSDRVAGNEGFDSFWVDSAPSELILDASAAEKAGGNIHRVGSFFNYRYYDGNGAAKTAVVSREISSQNLVDPDANGLQYASFRDKPLFATAGPTSDDVSQGNVGDCYYLAALASVADTDPNTIRQSVVDLGDGTYAVQFNRWGTTSFVRVDGDLPVWSGSNLVYADMGHDNSIWVAVMEKAWTLFRSNQGSYDSISSGWMSEAYSALDLSNSSLYSVSSAQTLVNWVKQQLEAGRAVTFATSDRVGQAALVGNHAYSVEGVDTDDEGNVSFRLRNPWGIDGAGHDGANDGIVTISAAQAFAAFSGVTAAIV